MRVDEMWCVTDPATGSEIEDVCFRTTPRGLIASAICAYELGKDQVRIMQSITVYTDEAEARADAEQRIARRGTR